MTVAATRRLWTDSITLNGLPIVIGDTTVYLCALEDICFVVTGIDPDGDAVWIDQTGGPGQTTTIDDYSAQTCFTPDSTDSATYIFYYRFLDDCDGTGDRARCQS